MQQHDSQPPPRSRLSAALLRVALYSLPLAIACYLLFPGEALTPSHFRAHDFPVLLIGGIALLAFAATRIELNRALPITPVAAVAILALLVLVATRLGTDLVFLDHPLTRDEIMADFDAAILAGRQAIAPIPAEWRPYAGALMPQFMLPVPPETGWASSYLPGNAALRAIGLLSVGAEWINPVLAAISVILVHAIGRRLWPNAPGAALAAALLAATSGQLLVMAMTPYAMTAHLAFNLLWLWCWLRGDRRGDAGAIAAGFAATGLHQLIFHPLFVAPFILTMWFSGQRRRALFYVLAYGAIGLFWASYWQIALGGGTSAGGSGLSALTGQLLELLSRMNPAGLLTMIFNLLRLLAWQNMILLPLALLAWPAIRNGTGIARPLAGGVALTLAAMLILLPWQGLGWGYRYMHGLLGSLALLAGYGWVSLAEERGRRAFVLASGTALTLAIVLPIQFIKAHQYAAPRARAYAAVVAADAEIVLVAPADNAHDDLVRNAPDLSNRPLVMDLRRLDEAQLRALCGRYRVSLFDADDGRRAGLGSIASDEDRRLAATAVRLGCDTAGRVAHRQRVQHAPIVAGGA